MPDASPQLPALFVAVGHQGQRITSTDGIAWSSPQLGKEGEVYRAVCSGNGHVVAVGNFGGDNIFASTADGATWHTLNSKDQYQSGNRGLAFGNGLFLALQGDPGAVGDSKPCITTSVDGVAWSPAIPIKGKEVVRRLAWGNGRFVGVGDRGRRVASPDGREWQDSPQVKAVDTMVDIAFGNGRFVGVGLHGLRMSSEDGIAWTDRLIGEEGEHLNVVLWTGDRFVAIGLGATFTSSDGLNWERTPNQNAPLAAAFGGGVFVGTHWRGRILRSTDAVAWHDVHKSAEHLEAVAFTGAPAG